MIIKLLCLIAFFAFHEVNSAALNCQCGREYGRTRIVNGQSVPEGLFPWMVALLAKSQLSQFCGGTLINDRWVLTAAHCVPNMAPSNVLVVSKHVHLQTLKQENVFDVDKIWLHPQYYGQADNHRNDIALLRLARPVQFSPQLLPICLPNANQRNFANLFNIGWGKTGVNDSSSRQLMYINTQQRDDCDRLYAHLGFWYKQFCTYAYGNGICQGDSGGPLASRIRGAVTQVGINSWVISGTCGEHPDVTTRVSDYLNDIYTVTQGANWCLNPNSP